MKILTDKRVQKFIEVARAFKKIRDQKLYEGEYPSFEAYCLTKYGKSADEVNKNIDIAETISPTDN